MLLGHPVGFYEAWVIETATVLVRSTLFFVPSAIGAQEGTFFLLCHAITGSSELGIAVALLRRFREFIWIAFGLGFAWSFGWGRVQRQ